MKNDKCRYEKKIIFIQRQPAKEKKYSREKKSIVIKISEEEAVAVVAAVDRK